MVEEQSGMKIIKRSGAEVVFDLDKIINAIRKANNTVREEDKLITASEKYVQEGDRVRIKE